MQKPLKDNIREHYERFSLPEEQLRALLALSKDASFSHQQVSESVGWGNASFVRVKKFGVLGLSLCLLIGLMLFGSRYLIRSEGERITLADIASEAAYHHNKHMSNEIVASSLDDLRVFFSKLDFSLIPSVRLPTDQFELLGGRYCSVKGVVAAQLKVKERLSGKVYTYYQADWPEGVTEISAPQEFYDRGVKVELWEERGLLLILAHDG